MNVLSMIRAFALELVFLVILVLVYLALFNGFELNVHNEFPIFEQVRQAFFTRAQAVPLNANFYSPLTTGLLWLSMKFGGVSLQSARLPILLMSLGGIVMTYLYCLVSIKSRPVALLSALVLATGGGFFMLSGVSAQGGLLTITLLSFFLTFQSWRAQIGKRKPQPQEIQRLSGLLGASLALVFLGGGTLGLFMALATVALFLLTTHTGRIQQYFQPKAFLMGLGLFILPWLVWGLFQPNGLSHIWHSAVASLFSIFQGIPITNIRLLSTLITANVPYLFFLGAFFWELQQHRRATGPSHLGQDNLNFLLLWLLVGLLVALLWSASNQSNLLLPCFVPLAIFTGSYLARFFDGEEPTDAYNVSIELAIIGTGLSAVLLSVFLFHTLSETHPIEYWHFAGPKIIEKIHFIKDIPLDPPFPVWKLWLTPGPFILLLGTVTLYILHSMRRSRQTGLALIVIWIVFLVFIKSLFIPVLHRPVHQQNAQNILQKIHNTPINNSIVWIDSSDRDLMGTAFYLNLPATQVVSSSLPALQNALIKPNQPHMLGVIKESDYYRLSPEARTNMRIIAHRWKWIHLDPGHTVQLFDGDYMQKLTYTILLFETLPPAPELDINQLALPTERSKKSRRRR